MTEANTICHDVDLLGDWLDAKGYTEEAGLCLRVLGLIHAQSEENKKLLERINNLQEIVREDTKELLQYRAKNERLRAALQPFADEASVGPMPGQPDDPRRCNMKFLRAAAAALKETVDE